MNAETTEIQTPEGYVYACDLADIPARGKKTVIVGDTRVLIVMCENGPYAVEDRCPQTGRTIAHGKVIERVITTPTTGARYHLVTGRYLGGGQSWLQSHWLPVWPTRVVAGRLYIRPPKV